MTTELHQSVVNRLVRKGYRAGGAREFCRLAYYLHEDLGLENARDVLMGFFQSADDISYQQACKVASRAKQAADDCEDAEPYEEARIDAPCPHGIPDAWIYRESVEWPGHMEIEFVEVLDTSRTGLAKIADYGSEFDNHESLHFVLYEIGANDGSIIRHDPMRAYLLKRFHETQEEDDATALKLARREYSEHLITSDLPIKNPLLSG